jgi:hypothetical protein
VLTLSPSLPPSRGAWTAFPQYHYHYQYQPLPSAPWQVSVKGDHSPVIRKRRPSGSKNVRILPNPQRVEATWAPWEYDRRPPLHNGFTLQQLIDMRNEVRLYATLCYDLCCQCHGRAGPRGIANPVFPSFPCR